MQSQPIDALRLFFVCIFTILALVVWTGTRFTAWREQRRKRRAKLLEAARLRAPWEDNAGPNWPLINLGGALAVLLVIVVVAFARAWLPDVRPSAAWLLAYPIAYLIGAAVAWDVTRGGDR